MTISSIRTTLSIAEAEARTRTAKTHADRALQEAKASLAYGHYDKAMTQVERAEAWIAYLQDPSIIEVERNLPA